MAAGDLYRKTDRGVVEITDRKLKVSPRLRTMLILVDGARPESMLKEEGAKVGAPEDFLEQLVALGLVEKAGRPSGPAAAGPRTADEFMRFRAAKDFMNNSIVEALGVKSFFFTMKLERAGTVADLLELAPAYRQALAKAVGDAEAGVLAGRLDEMLR